MGGDGFVPHFFQIRNEVKFMKTKTIVTTVLFSALVAFVAGIATHAAVAETPKVAQQAQKKAKKRDPGKRLYLRKTCIACHGRNGQHAIIDYPNLAGQDAKYMIAQVKYILSGKRVGSLDGSGNPRTQGMRGALVTSEGEMRISTDEVKQIVSWLAKLEPAKVVAPKQPFDPEKIKQGANLFKKKCRVCHGKNGTKPRKGYPYLAGQKASYLMVQVKDIRDKKRTSGKSKMMTGIVRKLTDEQIAMISNYLSQVDRTKK